MGRFVKIRPMNKISKYQERAIKFRYRSLWVAFLLYGAISAYYIMHMLK